MNEMASFVKSVILFPTLEPKTQANMRVRMEMLHLVYCLSLNGLHCNNSLPSTTTT